MGEKIVQANPLEQFTLLGMTISLNLLLRLKVNQNHFRYTVSTGLINRFICATRNTLQPYSVQTFHIENRQKPWLKSQELYANNKILFIFYVLTLQVMHRVSGWSIIRFSVFISSRDIWCIYS